MKGATNDRGTTVSKTLAFVLNVETEVLGSKAVRFGWH